MLDKTKSKAKSSTAVATASKAYGPTDFVREMKAAVDKAVANGVALTQIAHVTMGFAHSVWNECYDYTDSGDLLDKVAAAAPSWTQIEDDLPEWGYSTDGIG